MTLKLGSITTIVISSPQVAKQVLHENGQVFSSRTLTHSVHALDHHIYSTAWLPPSPQWRNLRRVHELLNFVEERCKKGEILDIGEAVFTTILNSISTTLFSIDLSNYASEKSHDFKNIFWGIVHELGRHNVADFFPILRPLDPQRVLARSTNYYKKLFKVFGEIIEERMSLRASKPDSMVCIDVLDSLLNTTEEVGSLIC
ncbi:Geraniol 8-hydroxylase, partial [Mucuna pruriens]